MWLKRKPQNRRLEREHVLDVKLRSSQIRLVRARLAAIALGTVFATVFGLYLLWHVGEWTLDLLVYENRAFAVQEIDVQTDGVLALDELRRWTGIKLGQNLLALDLARVKRDLELVPLVRSASVERILPHTVRIRVIEREPLAQINVPRPRPGGGFDFVVYQIDAAGSVMLPLSPHQRAAPSTPPAEQWPLISGINSQEIRAGRRLEAAHIQAALQLVDAFEHSSMAGLVDIKRIDLSSPEVLLVTTSQGSEVTFGLTDLERQLRRWREIFDLGQKMNKAIATLDLAVTNNIPARWLEASAMPPAVAPSPKPPRLKKKHV